MANKEVLSLVLKFLQDSNRPWSLNDILEKCGKNSGKSAIQKAIDLLVGDEKVVEKLYGKQKIFYLKQEDSNDKNNSFEISRLEKKFIDLQAELKTKEEKIQMLESQMKKFRKIPSISDLENESKSLSEDIEKLTEHLDKIKKSQNLQSVQFSNDDIEKIEKLHEKVSSAYRKRKRMCTEMVDAIMEGYPKSKKQLIEDIGLETDEDVGFQLKT